MDNVDDIDFRFSDKMCLRFEYQAADAMIAAGKYDWKDKDASAKNFSTPEDLVGKQADLYSSLFIFEKESSVETVISVMEAMNYRPAKACDLLAFAAMYPDMQKKHTIIALGTILKERRKERRALSVSSFENERLLEVYTAAYRFYAHDVFLAVQDKPVAKEEKAEAPRTRNDDVIEVEAEVIENEPEYRGSVTYIFQKSISDGKKRDDKRAYQKKNKKAPSSGQGSGDSSPDNADSITIKFKDGRTKVIKRKKKN